MNQHSYKTRTWHGLPARENMAKMAVPRPNARRLISNGLKSERLGRAFCIAVTVALIASGTAMAEEPKLRLASIKPTVFFIKEGNTLMLVSGNW